MYANSKVYENVLGAIGNTPMVKLQRIPQDYGLVCQFFAKCEFLNPGGSIKDRVAYEMIVDAIIEGLVSKETRFVEPTSGNTGIGVALVTTVLGYSSTIVSSDKNSDEKMNTMRCLGSDLIETPAAAHYGNPDNYMAITNKILHEDPNTYSCNQFSNPINPQTHYRFTATEILAQVPDVSMVVIAAGSGGTLAGISKKIKDQIPTCIIVAVDPQGSSLFGMRPMEYFVEGIGSDFTPGNLDKSHVDDVQYPNDKQSFNMAREVIRKEGIFCGGSSGAAIFGAIQAAKKYNLTSTDKVVIIIPDGITNYMSRFVTDQWMEAHRFLEPVPRKFDWYNRSMDNLPMIDDVPTVFEWQSARDAYIAMGTSHDVVFVITQQGSLKGVVSKDSLRNKATNPPDGYDIDFNEPVTKFFSKNYYKIVENNCTEGRLATVGLVSRILDIASFVVIVEEVHSDSFKGMVPKGIMVADIVLDFILENV